MDARFIPEPVHLIRFAPELLLTVFATLIMVLDPLTKEGEKHRLGILALVGLLAAAWGAAVAAANPGTAFSDMLLVDGFATFFRYLSILVGVLTLACSFAYLKREQADSGEYYALLLFSIAGQCVMVSANELIMIFIGLEISSIASYVLAGYLRDDKRNNESALKYFLLGSFATAFLLYGIAWIYGITGSTNLAEIQRVLSNRDIAPSVNLIGASAALMFVGFAFKVSAAPFQVWAPDVYQGAPAPVSAFLSAGPKAAAFAIFLRVYITAFEPIADQWQAVLWASALATMIVGNFAALLQSNIKRLLAYSSIAHAGYVLVAVTTHSQIGTAAAMFYLAAYAFMNVGAFAVVTHFARQGERYVNIEDLAGLGQRQPVTAALLSIFLLSFIGVPLTAGFFGKFYIFKAALDANLVWLTVLGLLNSAVAAYYYLRIIVVMYFHEPSESVADLQSPAPGIQAVLWASAAATLILGVFPSWVLDFAGKAALK
ncbi:MAG: NADH-quinone oxidoreductase subunit N [Bryobacteraceae bacterium]|nr:NADH-quinone oxidoreductase subunit N [Bryobacteraceae bacterium]MDW8379253.1 NADH-quinone oxidoreductase subunit N [Bryobacterales bacterium]